jgi:hypothetical protein
MVLWSAKHERRSGAKRIVRLVELIRKDNRGISRKVMEAVKRGEAIPAGGNGLEGKELYLS